MKQFLLPDPGEGLVEAEIVSWHVQPGDTVKINDVLVEVETSKSIVELPSPYAGTVKDLLVEEGQTVDVGAPIITIDDGTGTEASAEPTTGGHDQQPAPEQGEERVAVLVGYGAKASQAKRRPRKGTTSATPAAPTPTAPPQSAPNPTAPNPAAPSPTPTAAPGPAPVAPTPTPPAPAPTTDEPAAAPGTHAAAAVSTASDASPAAPSTTATATPSRPLAKPPVRKLAKDLGVDLTTLTGSGPDGVITREDVESAVTAKPEPAAPTTSPLSSLAASEDDVRIPIKGVRKATAQAMVSSAFTAPHVTEWVTCDVTATMELVESIKARREFRELRVTPLLIIAKACVLALKRTPAMNAAWDEAAQEIVHYGRVNLGIAAATPRGLVVPNVKDAQRLTLRELAEAMQKLITVAREGKIQPADTSGGTFSITNVGTFGVDAGTPILNPGQSGILAVGAINRRPWVVGTGAEERIEPRWVTTLAVSFDHRIVDGAPGSQFLADVADILSNPGAALLY